MLDHHFDGLLDAALQGHRIGAGRHVAHPLAVDALGQDGRGGRAVARHVAGLGGDFPDHLGAQVFHLVLQLDFLGHRHAVLGDGGRAELLLQDHVAALWTEGDLDGVRQLVDTLENLVAAILSVHDIFSHVHISLCLSFYVRESTRRCRGSRPRA